MIKIQWKIDKILDIAEVTEGKRFLTLPAARVFLFLIISEETLKSALRLTFRKE